MLSHTIFFVKISNRDATSGYSLEEFPQKSGPGSSASMECPLEVVGYCVHKGKL
jgi:hypothetical protein